jgi:hypothetical protein
MHDLPTKDAEKGTACTVADFLEAGRERLSLSVVVGGRGLKRKIYEPIVNRPGLALAGFYSHFPWRRVQVFGNAEFAYVRSMTRDLRVARLREMIRRRASVFVFTAGHRPSAAAQALAAEKGVVMLASPLTTRDFAYQATVILGELNAPRTALYGTMVEVSGLGVFLEGAAGLGKSETALGLLKRGAALVASTARPSGSSTVIRHANGAGFAKQLIPASRRLVAPTVRRRLFLMAQFYHVTPFRVYRAPHLWCPLLRGEERCDTIAASSGRALALSERKLLNSRNATHEYHCPHLPACRKRGRHRAGWPSPRLFVWRQEPTVNFHARKDRHGRYPVHKNRPRVDLARRTPPPALDRDDLQEVPRT